MADKIKEAISTVISFFTPVSLGIQDVGSPQRHPSGAVVSSSGRTTLNSNALELLNRLARALGLDPQEYAVRYGVDAERRLIEIYPVPMGSTGAQPLRRVRNRPSAVLYLLLVFTEFPVLRASVSRYCGAYLHDNPEGQSCLVLSLQTALIRRRGSRGAAEVTEPVRTLAQSLEQVVPTKMDSPEK